MNLYKSKYKQIEWLLMVHIHTTELVNIFSKKYWVLLNNICHCKRTPLFPFRRARNLRGILMPGKMSQLITLQGVADKRKLWDDSPLPNAVYVSIAVGRKHSLTLGIQSIHECFTCNTLSVVYLIHCRCNL